MSTKLMEQVASSFPYITMLFAFFIGGLIFLSINMPLIVTILSGAPKYTQSVDIPNKIILEWWKTFFNLKTSLLVSFLFMLFVLVVGFIINAITQLLALISGILATHVLALFGKKTYFFTGGIDFLEENYASMTAWLMKHKEEKLQWEWEIFNYYLYWGISMNMLIYFMADLKLINKINLCLLFISFLFILYSLLRSNSLGKYHLFCIKQSKNDQADNGKIIISSK